MCTAVRDTEYLQQPGFRRTRGRGRAAIDVAPFSPERGDTNAVLGSDAATAVRGITAALGAHVRVAQPVVDHDRHWFERGCALLCQHHTP